MTENKEITTKQKSLKSIISVIALLVLFVTVVILFKKYSAISAEKERLASVIDTLQGAPANKTVDEKKILEKVSKLMVLPENEQPTLFTILNADALAKDQPFFVGSVSGDVLLVFRQSQKAVIYSPSNRKIVNAGPIISSLETKPGISPTSSAMTTGTKQTTKVK